MPEMRDSSADEDPRRFWSCGVRDALWAVRLSVEIVSLTRLRGSPGLQLFGCGLIQRELVRCDWYGVICAVRSTTTGIIVSSGCSMVSRFRPNKTEGARVLRESSPVCIRRWLEGILAAAPETYFHSACILVLLFLAIFGFVAMVSPG